MPIDRTATLRNAEKLLRQGRLDQAIDEYLRVVTDQPADWNTANVLGDLFVRAGQHERAIAEFLRIAGALETEGFLSRANAVYKKALKLDPTREDALFRAGRIAAKQGLAVQARALLHAVSSRRQSRGDESGVAEVAALLRTLDPADVDPSPAEARSSDGDPVPADQPAAAMDAEAPASPALAQDDIASNPGPVAAVERADSGPNEPSELDLTAALDALTSAGPAVAANAGSPASLLDNLFAGLRDEASQGTGEDEAQAGFQRALILLEAGRLDEAIVSLARASRSPRLRFAAASRLGRLHRERGETREAIEWFERAVEAPAPGPTDGYLVLYELGGVLESAGEPDRAMAVYLELHADAGNFRDVADRMDRLGRLRTGG